MPGYDSPVKLKSARAWRTYLGGRLIDELHGVTPAADTHFPEDWIMSTVRAINAGREDVVEGLNLIDGTDITLKEYIEADPAAALGAAHVARWGASTAVLLKLIDAAERLGIQCHPDKAKALEFFGSQFGKTECWHIVGGRVIDGERPGVYMGFKPGVTAEMWRDVFERQDIPSMLGMLHRIEVKPGDTFLIEGGTPHAIGRGCLLMEIQEPTDYTFRTERVTTQGLKVPERACHYGIGFDNMFACFHYEGRDEEGTRKACMVEPKVLEKTADFVRTEIVGYSSTPCFMLERYDIGGRCRFAAGGEFAGLYVFSGAGRLKCGAGCMAVRPGDQFFVPASSTGFSVESDGGLAVFLARSAK